MENWPIYLKKLTLDLKRYKLNSKKDVLWDTLVINHEKVKVCHGKINHCNNYYRPKANVKSYSI